MQKDSLTHKLSERIAKRRFVTSALGINMIIYNKVAYIFNIAIIAEDKANG
jgi:hypothetical protein